MTGMFRCRTKFTWRDFARGSSRSALLVLAALAPARGARAQAIVASVNGDPVTNTDLAERAKLLRAMGMPSSPSAMDSLIQSRLKASEINKYNITSCRIRMAPTIPLLCRKGAYDRHAAPAADRGGPCRPKHLENFFSIHVAFNMYTRARNRAVEASREATWKPKWRAIQVEDPGTNLHPSPGAADRDAFTGDGRPAGGGQEDGGAARAFHRLRHRCEARRRSRRIRRPRPGHPNLVAVGRTIRPRCSTRRRSAI